MQLSIKLLCYPAQATQWSYEEEHDVQLIEHGMQFSAPLSINPLLQLNLII